MKAITKEQLGTALTRVKQELDSSAGEYVPAEKLWSAFEEDTAYAVGDVFRTPSTPSWGYWKVTTAGTSGSTVPDSTTEGATATSGTMVCELTRLGSGGGSEYVLPTASASTLGGIKVGNNLTIDANGVLSATTGGILPRVIVTAPTGSTVTCAKDGTTLTATESSGTWTFDVPSFGNWTVTATKTVGGAQRSSTEIVNVSIVKEYQISLEYIYRYGIKIDKNDSNPATRVKYLFDAVGMTPAYMDFTEDSFNYGDWQNVWFVSDNKPLMLKSDGTVDYYLNPNNYDQKEDGEASDVSSTSYDGNAMAQIPLCWVKRYEDDNYLYEIVSNVQYDNDYKAYAHTRADGSIADYFYWSLFEASITQSKLRSLSGKTVAQSLTATEQVTAAESNGSGWYIHTWSQRELIRTLLMIMCRSTNTQRAFGYGNFNGSSLVDTGTIKKKGQFYGDTSDGQMKAFHIEGIWGNQFDRVAGFIGSDDKIYVKMTPEGAGYKFDSVTGYENTNISSQFGTGYSSRVKCGDYGMIPTSLDGSDSTYFCDHCWGGNGYLVAGGWIMGGQYNGGMFSLNLDNTYDVAIWHIGCGLSCEQPAPTE